MLDYPVQKPLSSRTAAKDPDRKGGFHGPRETYREESVNPRYRQWNAFEPPPGLEIWDQMELPFPVDPTEIP